MKTNLHLYKTSKCYLHHIFESFQFIKANYNSHQPIDHNFVVLPKSIEKLFPYSPSCFSIFSPNAPTHLPKAPCHQYCLTNTPLPLPPPQKKILNKTSCKSIHEISPPSQNLWQKSYINKKNLQESKNMIDGKENENTTTKDKCKSLGHYPNHQWLQQKRKKKMTSTTPRTPT
jgi:hypothetical protein